MPQKPKNPLNVMFGAFIQNERRNFFTNIPIDELAKRKLGMSVSLYKMTEAGLTSFNLNRAINLLEAFKDSDLIFDRVIKFVAGQNIVDALISNQKLSSQEAFAQLSKIDEEFKLLYAKTEKYFELREDSQEHSEFIQSQAIPEVKMFLQNQKYTNDNGDELEENPFIKLFVKKIQFVPSLNIGLLFDFIKSFSHITPLHFEEIASKWEDDNSREFESLYGIFKTPDLIISEHNLQRFHHLYLAENKFSRVSYIFCDGSKNVDDLKWEYQRLLNRYRKEKDFPEISDNIFKKKVSIKLLNGSNNSLVKDLLRNPHNHSNLLEAFWVFNMRASDNKIGFAGVSQSNVNVVYNLSFGEVIKRALTFERLWKML